MIQSRLMDWIIFLTTRRSEADDHSKTSSFEIWSLFLCKMSTSNSHVFPSNSHFIHG